VQLSLIHPRLFHSLALIEPVIQRNSPSGPNAAFLTSHRPDLWPSRSKAEASFRSNPFFKTWESRVLDKHLQYALRDTPTALYPASTLAGSTKATPGAVTLKTTKHQEAWSYVRSNFAPQSADPIDPIERLLSPDLDPADSGTYLFHRAESILALQGLPNIRPRVLWVFGARSHINTPALQDEKMALSGTGIGGSGGVRAGMVEKAVVEEAAHMVPFEKVQECAVLLARWLEKQIDSFRAEEVFYREHKSGKSEREMLAMSKEWLKGVRQKADTRRPIKGKL
jgi:pimeloyl-ACP methyl ester carboxylesterase